MTVHVVALVLAASVVATSPPTGPAVTAPPESASSDVTLPVPVVRLSSRLVTPPGGVVCDPFAGSGTTIEAAMLEGFDVIGIEREPDYLPLIQARIDRVAS